MIVNVALFSEKDKSLDSLRKALEKEGFEVLEVNAGLKQLIGKE